MCERVQKIAEVYQKFEKGPYAVIPAGSPPGDLRQAGLEARQFAELLNGISLSCQNTECCMKQEGQFFVRRNPLLPRGSALKG